MNDFWNDPPEQEELPECCEEIMEFDEQTAICKCLKCGSIIEPQVDYDPVDFLE